jgi:hypothetical protein
MAPEDASAADEAALLAHDEVLFGARVDPRSNAAVGRRLTLSVDPSRFHFFDRETGASLLAPSARPARAELPAELAPA